MPSPEICKKCRGVCCIYAGDVEVSRQEKDILEPFGAKFYKEEGVFYMRKLKTESCQFLRDSFCIIHKFRPETCIEYDCLEDPELLNLYYDKLPKEIFQKDGKGN